VFTMSNGEVTMELFKRLAFKGVQPFSFATTLALMLGSQQGYAPCNRYYPSDGFPHDCCRVRI
jgi:hypothetical protein